MSANRRTWVALAAVLLIGAAAVLLPLARGSATPVRTALVVRSDLRVTVSCTGRLGAPREGELRAPEAAGVEALEVAEGAEVREGQPLLRLASPELADQRLEARSRLAELEAEHAAAAAELAEARSELASRRSTTEQDARLMNARAISRAAAELDAAALAAAQGRLAAAASRAASLDPSDGGSRLALARARVAELDARVAALLVRAPVAGTVVGLPHVGDTVSRGQSLGGVVQPARPHLRLQVDAPDVTRVAPGQQLRARFDGLPGRTFDGTLLLVERGLRPSDGREVAEGTGELADPGRLLPLSARVSVDVIVGERKGALVVPRGALQREGELRFVLVVRDGRARRRAVQVGLVGLSEVEVLDGLQAGEQVILPGAEPVASGQRVRPDAG